jgi:hypothetical protein
MKYLETEEEKKSFAIHQLFCDSILFFYLGLTSLDPPPENGIAINFGTTGLGLATFNRQNPSICTNSNCGKANSSK